MWYDGGMSIKEHPPLHVPVLLDDVVRLLDPKDAERSEERRVGKECRSRWSPYH